jgi:hypothetical protein
MDATGAATMLAYIDPGAGSFVLQAIVASVAGAALLLKTYWKKVKALFASGAGSEAGEQTGRARSGDE